MKERRYEEQHHAIVLMSRLYPGWSRSEILDLSPRERFNYIRSALPNERR